MAIVCDSVCRSVDWLVIALFANSYANVSRLHTIPTILLVLCWHGAHIRRLLALLALLLFFFSCVCVHCELGLNYVIFVPNRKIEYFSTEFLAFSGRSDGEHWLIRFSVLFFSLALLSLSHTLFIALCFPFDYYGTRALLYHTQASWLAACLPGSTRLIYIFFDALKRSSVNAWPSFVVIVIDSRYILFFVSFHSFICFCLLSCFFLFIALHFTLVAASFFWLVLAQPHALYCEFIFNHKISCCQWRHSL